MTTEHQAPAQTETASKSSLPQISFASGVGWTAAGLGTVVVSGGVIQLLVGNAYGSSGLGVYAVGLSIYMIGSIASSFGVHTSVLRWVPELQSSRTRRSECTSTAIMAGVALGGMVAVLLSLLAEPLASFTRMPVLAGCLRLLSLAVPIFTLNRILLAYLNGLQWMRMLAVLQATRWLLILGVTARQVVLGKPLTELFWSFLVAELVVFVVVLAATFSTCDFTLRNCRWWTREHLEFGLKSSLSSIVIEVQTRLDILILSAFLAPRQVGVYSVAQFCAQAILYIPATVRPNIDPIIARHWSEGRKASVESQADRIVPLTRVVTGAAAVVMWILFPLLVRILFPNKPEFADAWIPLGVLLLGATWFSGYAALGNLFSQTGVPGEALRNAMIRLACYLPLSLVLIWQWGILGAAVAVALTFLVGIGVTRWQARRVLGLRLRV